MKQLQKKMTNNPPEVTLGILKRGLKLEMMMTTIMLPFMVEAAAAENTLE